MQHKLYSQKVWINNIKFVPANVKHLVVLSTQVVRRCLVLEGPDGLHPFKKRKKAIRSIQHNRLDLYLIPEEV